MLVHAELPGPIKFASATLEGSSSPPNRYATWLASRPRASENDAIAMLVRLSQEFGARIHIVHLSSSDAIAPLQTARAERATISVETCPHHPTFTSEDIADGATEFKCAPPIRERTNREALWTALRSGTIDLVASDHSPCPPAMKLRDQGDFRRAWGGIASLQLGLPVVWTEARSRGYALSDVAKWMCSGPAQLAGLSDKKERSRWAATYRVIVDQDAGSRVDPEKLIHRHKRTPVCRSTATRVRRNDIFARANQFRQREDFRRAIRRSPRRGLP